MTWGLGVIVLAYSPWVPLSFVTLLIVGTAFATTFVLATGIVLRVVEPAYHGRVMGTMTLNWGANVIGTLAAGSIAEALGVSIAVGLSGVFIVAATIGIVLTHPRILKLEVWHSARASSLPGPPRPAGAAPPALPPAPAPPRTRCRGRS